VPLKSTENERVRKAKRTRAVLIFVVIVLLLGLSGLGYLGYTKYQEAVEVAKGQTENGLKPTTTIPGELVDEVAPGEVRVDETSIPNLAALFGMTTDEVQAQLGGSFQLTKNEAAEDPTNPAIRQLATFVYTPTVSGTAAGTTSAALLPSESIYASLDEGGRVIDIYYSCDLRLLGYPSQSFGELLASSDVLTSSLQAAGVTPRDLEYVAPDPEQSTTYDNPASENRKVIKQSQIFSGRTSSETVPTAWTLTITYDFGSGVASASEYSQATRIINLKLA
jgi:hypothetical protein